MASLPELKRSQLAFKGFGLARMSRCTLIANTLWTPGPSVVSCLMRLCRMAISGSFWMMKPTRLDARGVVSGLLRLKPTRFCLKLVMRLSAEWTRLRAEHRRRRTQARCVHRFFVAVQRCAMDRLQEVAPRKSTGVLAPVQQECCLPSWGDDTWAVQAPFPDLPDVIPKLGQALFARFVLLRASLLTWSPGRAHTGDFLG